MSSRRVLSAFGLLACSCDGSGSRTRVSEEEFGLEYVDKLCEEWARCNEDGTPCPISAAGDTTTDIVAECDFDAEAAQSCLDIDWICGMSGFPQVVPPAICHEVCG